MSDIGDAEAGKERKPWTKPVLRRIRLTDEEVAALRGSDDPIASLLELKPELARKTQGGA